MTNPNSFSDNDNPDLPGGPLQHSEIIAMCIDYSLGHQMHHIRALRSVESDDWEPAEIITVVGHHVSFMTDSGIRLMWNHDPLFLWSRVNLAVQSTDAEVIWSARFSMLKIRVGGRRGGYCVGLQDGPVTPCTY